MPQRNSTRVTRMAENMEASEADGQRDGEALDGAAAKPEEDDGGDQRGEVRVENRGEGLFIGGLDGVLEGFAGGDFLAQAFVDQHVGVHRHADGQDHAGDAGQR